MESLPKPPHWRFVASQLFLLPFDLWLLLPFGLVTLVAAQLYFVHLPQPYDFVATGVLGGALALIYGIFVKPWIERRLRAEVVGPFILRHLKRPVLLCLFNPDTNIIAWLLLFLLFFWWLYSVSRTGPFQIAIFLPLGYVCSILFTRTVSSIHDGRADIEVLTRSLLRRISLFMTLLLVALVVKAGAFFIMTTLLAICIRTMTSFSRVGISKQRIENASHDRDFGIRINARSWFLETIWSLTQFGMPSRFLWQLFRLGKLFGFTRKNEHKELTKTKCIILSRMHHYHEMISEAQAYNRDFDQTGQGSYSETIKNYEALGYMWQGKLKEAEGIINKALDTSRDNLYFLSTRARIKWQMDERAEALSILDNIMERQKICPHATAYKMYFLEELALEYYFREDIQKYHERLYQAEEICQLFESYEDYLSDLDLVHNRENLALLQLYETRIQRSFKQKVSVYHDAMEHFLWCVWNGSHRGARFKIALLHAIGTRRYDQSLAYLRWIRDTLEDSHYSRSLPFSRRLHALISSLERAHDRKLMFKDKIILYQGTGKSIPLPEDGRVIAESPHEQEEAQQMRARIFRTLRMPRTLRPIYPTLSTSKKLI